MFYQNVKLFFIVILTFIKKYAFDAFVKICSMTDMMVKYAKKC